MQVTKSILFALLLASAASALDFRGATVVVPAGASLPEKTAAKMLTEEIVKRTQFRLKTSTTMPSEGPAILIRAGTGPGPEGFSLTSSAEGSRPVATVRGADARGVIFGTGYLLRQFKMERQQHELAGGLNLQNEPKIAIRGHQLGFRP